MILRVVLVLVTISLYRVSGLLIGNRLSPVAIHPRGSLTRLLAKAGNEVFYCTECGVEHVKWVGRCTSCNEWNCVKPMRLPRQSNKQSSPLDPRTSPGMSPRWLPVADQSSGMIKMNTIAATDATFRHTLTSKELNRVLGGGLVRGSTILLAGEPGIGKSTMLIQLANSIVSSGYGSVVYLSGEENPQQIAARALRLQLSTEGIYVLCETDADRAVQSIAELTASSGAPALVIVDSVQTLHSSTSTTSAGSVGQIRDSTALLVQLAKSSGSAVLLAGHVTKSGEVAGPRILEHMVDTVLYMEGNEQSEHRLLRSVKNRFGSTSEVGVFAMTERGLEDVSNPSELFLTPVDDDPVVARRGVDGAAVGVLLEGSRPLLAEIQCLVNGRPEFSPNSAGGGGRMAPPRRAADGFPLQRLQLICAVIEKRLPLPLWNKDVYVNVVGGLRVSEPSADLAVAMSVISSALEEPIKPRTAFVGEIGLGGELRAGKRLEERIKEAQKMGFERVIVPKILGRPHAVLGRGEHGGAAGGTMVLQCKTLFDALAAAFVNPEVAQSFSNRAARRKYNNAQKQFQGKGSSRSGPRWVRGDVGDEESMVDQHDGLEDHAQYEES